MRKVTYALYNLREDAFWYNKSQPHSSWTETIKHAHLKNTIADIFLICCYLYEKEFYDLNLLSVVEVIFTNEDMEIDYENPIWIGGPDKIIQLWGEVEPHLKPWVIRALYEDGNQKMHKVVNSWWVRKL